MSNILFLQKVHCKEHFLAYSLDEDTRQPATRKYLFDDSRNAGSDQLEHQTAVCAVGSGMGKVVQ